MQLTKFQNLNFSSVHVTIQSWQNDQILFFWLLLKATVFYNFLWLLSNMKKSFIMEINLCIVESEIFSEWETEREIRVTKIYNLIDISKQNFNRKLISFRNYVTKLIRLCITFRS